MRTSRGWVLAGLLAAGLLLVLPPSWGAMQSPQYRISSAVVLGGGGPGTSTSYRLVAGVGQATPIGLAQGPQVYLRAGFYYTLLPGPTPLVPLGALELLLLTP